MNRFALDMNVIAPPSSPAAAFTPHREDKGGVGQDTGVREVSDFARADFHGTLLFTGAREPRYVHAELHQGNRDAEEFSDRFDSLA